MATIRRFNGSTEAYLWKGKLAAAGIKSTVVDDVDTGAALPSYSLVVREKDFGRANKILDSEQTKRPFRATRASLYIGFTFSFSVITSAILLLIFSEDMINLIMGIIFLIFGVGFGLPFFLALIRKK